ncbi:MAG TPA: sigma-54 dependent transcriptional regulator [Polyangiaceae bacterium]|jgi:two-component system response regulator HydG|nr:sigma-54 dependent transcriptional regulator [Polyangiaceae bacterium]
MERRILIIDDDRNMCDVLETELRRREFDVTSLTVPADAIALFEREDFGLVITDVNMAGMSGVELCKQLTARREDMPVIVITAFGNMETAVAAIRAGAYDFITKPFDTDELALTIERALRHRALKEEVKRLRKAVDGTERFDEILGTSSAILKMCELVTRVADTETTVLITGESGTGKELVAKALHAKSSRREGPFVAINCAAMPESLLESELFGHVKGAFTDARTARPGLFIKASKGTLLLDEIGEMPAGMQAKLLRALQERTVRPVGGDQEQPFDTRIVAATNRDLETEVEEKRFREDLFYRINVVRVHVPPLRSRGSDVLLLAQHFLERYAAQSHRPVVGMTSAAADKLLSYPWPGNVRELQNCIERAVALAQFDQVGVDDLPEKIRDHKTARINIESNDPADLLSMDEVERRYILKVLEAVGGNKTLAAQVLGFDRRTLYRKLERVRDPGAAREQRSPSSGRMPAATPIRPDEVKS